MKYLLLTDGTGYIPELLVPFERAGLYCWKNAFDGDVRMWGDLKRRKHELLDYDIIHVNVHGDDVGLAAEVAPLLKDTDVKLVINMDISIDYFDKHLNLKKFIADIHAADYMFSVEPTQVNLINYLAFITKREKKGWCKLMPHPVNVPMLLDKAFVEYDKRMDIVAFQFHKYDGHWEIPRMLMVDLPNEYLGAMLGYTKKTIEMQDMPHICMPYMDWTKYIHFLARCKVGFEYRTHKAASRFVMEAGALGIPTVTTHDSHMGKIIFPELCHPVGDYFGIRESIIDLITKDEYRLELARLGIERLEPYNLENSKKRMMELIE